MRFAVTGGRHFHDRAMVIRVLCEMPEDAVMVNGMAPGADALCAQVWRGWGRTVDPFPADWGGPCRDSCEPGHRKPRRGGGSYCPAAGHYRNQAMVDSGIEELVALPGGNGTADMTARSVAAGVKVRQATQVPG